MKKQRLASLLGGAFIFICASNVWALNKVTVTAATGGSAISADTTGGTWTTLTGPVLTESSSADIHAGTIILTAPNGFLFNAGVTQEPVWRRQDNCPGVNVCGAAFGQDRSGQRGPGPAGGVGGNGRPAGGGGDRHLVERPHVAGANKNKRSSQ